MHRGGVVEDSLGVLAGVLHQLRALAPDFALDERLLGDDVRRAAAADHPCIYPRGAITVAWDRVEVLNGGRHRLDRVVACIRLVAGMGGCAREVRAEVMDREEVVDARNDLARRVVEADVHS